MTLPDSPTSGNPPRTYCFVAPAGTTSVVFSLTGGTCHLCSTCMQTNCAGRDLEFYLRKDDPADPFEPDELTQDWSYTPGAGAMGQYMKQITPGVWFVSSIVGLHGSHTRNVSFSLSLR